MVADCTFIPTTRHCERDRATLAAFKARGSGGEVGKTDSRNSLRRSPVCQLLQQRRLPAARTDKMTGALSTSSSYGHCAMARAKGHLLSSPSKHTSISFVFHNHLHRTTIFILMKYCVHCACACVNLVFYSGSNSIISLLSICFRSRDKRFRSHLCLWSC